MDLMINLLNNLNMVNMGMNINMIYMAIIQITKKNNLILKINEKYFNYFYKKINEME